MQVIQVCMSERNRNYKYRIPKLSCLYITCIFCILSETSSIYLWALLHHLRNLRAGTFKDVVDMGTKNQKQKFKSYLQKILTSFLNIGESSSFKNCKAISASRSGLVLLSAGRWHVWPNDLHFTVQLSWNGQGWGYAKQSLSIEIRSILVRTQAFLLFFTIALLYLICTFLCLVYPIYVWCVSTAFFCSPFFAVWTEREEKFDNFLFQTTFLTTPRPVNLLLLTWLQWRQEQRLKKLL